MRQWTGVRVGTSSLVYRRRYKRRPRAFTLTRGSADTSNRYVWTLTPLGKGLEVKRRDSRSSRTSTGSNVAIVSVIVTSRNLAYPDSPSALSSPRNRADTNISARISMFTGTEPQSIVAVRRDKAPFLSGCESRPATVAPAGSSRGGRWRQRHRLKHFDDKGPPRVAQRPHRP